MKKYLIKLAHWILKKYELVPVEMGDTIVYKNHIFKIYSMTINMGYGCESCMEITAREVMP